MIHQLINSNVAHYSGIVYNGESFHAHFHNSYELIYVLDGNINVKVGVDSFVIGENEFLLIAPCAVHSIVSGDNSRFFIAIVSPDYIPDFASSRSNDILVRFSAEDSAIEFIKDRMIYQRKAEHYLLKSCLYLILSYAKGGEVLLSAKNIDVSFVYTVNSYISKHFTERISRSELARLVGCEEHYFSTLFHKHFGMNMRKYISMYRVSHACRLLNTTNENISSIALDSGFSSIREFNAVFAELMHITPKEFRAQAK